MSWMMYYKILITSRSHFNIKKRWCAWGRGMRTEQKFEPVAPPARVGRKQRKQKGPEAAARLPMVTPLTKCKLTLLKLERIKDYLLMEEEFVTNQERLKPQEEKTEEDRSKVDDLRGSPMSVGNLEELIDENHAIVSSSVGPEYYVGILSFVDKDQLEPGCAILMHNKVLSVVGLLQDEVDPMVSVMKVEKAPLESYADIGRLDAQIQEIKEAVELPLTHPELSEKVKLVSLGLSGGRLRDDLVNKMDNNYATKKGRKDLIEEFVALQHVVSSINYACAMYIVILHAAFKKKEISKHFNNVLKAVLRLHGLLLKKPEPIADNCTDDRWSYGTYVKVLAPAIDKPRYRTRKGEIATNVLGVCSQDMQFIYVLLGWEGSASDSRDAKGMDDTGTTSSHKKGKPRRSWNHREELFLITTMKDVTASNPRWKFDNNQFRTGFYNECEKKILSTFPGTDLRATPHIDSKIKLWRKQYNILQDMLKISGFGWDDEQKMVLVDSDDPFPFYEDWLLLFGKDRATGELAKDLADAVTAMEKEDANAITEGEQSPVEQFSMNMGDTDYSMSTIGNVPNRANSTKTGKKRARPAEGIPIELSEMAKNLGSFIENTNITMVEIAYRIGYSHDLSQQRRLVNAELLKLPMSWRMQAMLLVLGC
ncbi:unnamed protein product [Camellia sinensis]